MAKYYVNFYQDKDGSELRGDWKSTEEGVDEEKDSYVYKVTLGLRWQRTVTIERSVAEDMAEKHNVSVSEILECV